MDFNFTPEQVMLRNTVRELLSRESSPRTARDLMDDPTGYNEATWRQLADLGLTGITIDEQRGGQGLGLVEQALVLDEMGRAAYPGPYFATVVLAASAIQAGGVREQLDAYLPKIADGSLKATLAGVDDAVTWEPRGVAARARRGSGGYVLNGTKHLVPFAHVADLLLVAARTADSSDPTRGVTIFAVQRDSPGLTITPRRGMDSTNRLATVTLEDVRVGAEAIIGQPDQGWEILQTVLRRAAVGAAAEMLGTARRCMELSVEYAKVRQQFGQPIGSFQAVKHTCAEMLMEVEHSHGAVYYAAWAQDADASDAALAASVAKSFVGESARKVCGASIQVHGGIGFTWDYDLHLYFKHAKHYEALYGDAETHRELVLREVSTPQTVPVLA